ncbi:MAG: HAMP domain-containing protein, partial [Clostridium sp.]
MRKKIFLSISITVIFALIIFATSFSVLMNMRDMKNTKETLKQYNTIISNSKMSFEEAKNLTINGIAIRITVISPNGEVIYDSEPSRNDNHSNRPEIIEAIKSGQGEAIRYSATLNKQMIYVANVNDKGNIVRSSVSLESVEYINIDNMKYTVLITGIIILMSVLFSRRLIGTIISPVEELKNVTSKIAKGDLSIRVNINSSDELGVLG